LNLWNCFSLFFTMNEDYISNWQNIGAQVSARLTNVVTQVQMTSGKAFYRVAQVP
jgi:ribosomal protein S16